MSGLGARFDWYACTWDESHPRQAARHLAALLGCEVSDTKGMRGYSTGYLLHRGDDTVCKVFGFGRNAPDEVHLQSSSDACDVVVPAVRSMYPGHRVTRADSALDFRASFTELEPTAIAFAEQKGLQHGGFTDSEGGASRRLGSMRSESFVVLYKKSEQLRSLDRSRAHTVEAGIVRAEFRIKPEKRATKSLIANSTADELWGYSGWGKEFAEKVLDLRPARTQTHYSRPTDFARAAYWMGEQYRRTWGHRAQEVGIEQARSEALRLLGLEE